MNFTITPMDPGAVALIITLIQILKVNITNKSLIRVLPLFLGWFIAVPVVIITKGVEMSWWVLASNILLEGLKMAALSYMFYDLGQAAIRSNRIDN